MRSFVSLPAALVACPLATCLFVTSLLVTGLLVTGCSAAEKTKRLFGGRLALQVEVAPDVNRDSPLAVDVLVVYDQGLLDKLLALDASAYFAQARQLKRDFPDDLDDWSYEWVPGQEAKELRLSFRSGARAAVVFARYASPGAHRARLDPRDQHRLVLGAESFAVLPYSG